MKRISALLTSLLILGCALLTSAGPKEDVAATTQASIDAMPRPAKLHRTSGWESRLSKRRCAQ
jgi:hypothetical protein